MITICVFIKDTLEAEERLERMTENFPCFIEVETVEFDYVQVLVKCRAEDAKGIKEWLANLM